MSLPSTPLHPSQRLYSVSSVNELTPIPLLAEQNGTLLYVQTSQR